MSEPRKHHYIPQFYLRGFSKDGRRIHQIEKKTGRAYECSIRDAAAIRDYHELDHPTFEDPNALEKQLADAEGHFATILSEVLNSGILNREQHVRLIELLNLIRVRIPAQKAYIERTLEDSVRSVGKLMERHGKLPPPATPGASVMDEVLIRIRNFKCLEMMFRLAADPDILGLLASMKPTLIDAPEGSLFLTCDQPVALYHPTATGTEPYGVALIDPLTEISFPLSTRVLLKLGWPTAEIERRFATTSEVDEFNRRTVITADAYIFAHAFDEATANNVERYAKYSAGVQNDTLDTGDSIYHVSRTRPVLAPERYE